MLAHDNDLLVFVEAIGLSVTALYKATNGLNSLSNVDPAPRPNTLRKTHC